MTPDTYLAPELEGKVMRLDGNLEEYGYYAVMVFSIH